MIGSGAAMRLVDVLQAAWMIAPSVSKTPVSKTPVVRELARPNIETAQTEGWSQRLGIASIKT
jgi:hypothetical protein